MSAGHMFIDKTSKCLHSEYLMACWQNVCWQYLSWLNVCWPNEVSLCWVSLWWLSLMMSVIMLSVILLSVVMLSVILLSVVMLRLVTISVTKKKKFHKIVTCGQFQNFFWHNLSCYQLIGLSFDSGFATCGGGVVFDRCLVGQQKWLTDSSCQSNHAAVVGQNLPRFSILNEPRHIWSKGPQNYHCALEFAVRWAPDEQNCKGFPNLPADVL